MSAGSCTFDEGFSQCDYQQDPYDDFDWTQINTQEVPYVSPELPQGKSLQTPWAFLQCVMLPPLEHILLGFYGIITPSAALLTSILILSYHNDCFLGFLFCSASFHFKIVSIQEKNPYKCAVSRLQNVKNSNTAFPTFTAFTQESLLTKS